LFLIRDSNWSTWSKCRIGLSGRPYVRHLCRQTDIAYVALQLFTTVQSVFIQTGLKILQKNLNKSV